MTGKFIELAIERADPVGLARFWYALPDYEVQGEGDGVVTIGSPSLIVTTQNRLPLCGLTATVPGSAGRA